MTDLKPCPFCGGKGHHRCGGPGNHYVKCFDCGVSTDDGSQERAIAAWNRRALSPVKVEGPSVKVRPLDWKTDLYGIQTAQHSLGSYSCPRFHNEWDLLRDGYNVHPKVHGVIKAYPSLEAAQSAAQADFETRIRSTLVEQVTDETAERGETAGTRHEFVPNKKYPWFCAHCGYAPHEPMKHVQPASPPSPYPGTETNA